jgi:F420-dependent oxidoreductase-like protein
MRIGIAFSYAGGFREAADQVVEFEKIGVTTALVAEAYSYDVISQLGYLAAKTSTIELSTGIVPIYTRTPALLAMTAAGLDYVSDGRVRLGIGTSGPQVVEGFHGVAFDSPLGRTREIVDICRQVWRRERLTYDGRHHQIPLPPASGTGLGKPLRLINHHVRERIPITIAALGPKNVQLTAEIADGWQPVFFYPEKAEARSTTSRLQSAMLRPAESSADVVIAQTAPFMVAKPGSDGANHPLSRRRSPSFVWLERWQRSSIVGTRLYALRVRIVRWTSWSVERTWAPIAYPQAWSAHRSELHDRDPRRGPAPR